VASWMHAPTMSSSIRHVAVMVDGSAAAERALLEAAAIADEHEASLTVIAPVPHDRRTDGPAVRAVRRAAWNRTLDAAAEADLAHARALLGEREPEPRYRAVSGSVVSGVRSEVARLGCDLLVLPNRGRFRNGQARRLRRTLAAHVLPR
jgi:nucleotide-binding universal stress UspA family protein